MVTYQKARIITTTILRTSDLALINSVFLLQVSDPGFFSDCLLLTKEVSCKLQYLDLSMAVISEEGIEK